jgi:hypothetical protein
MGAGLRCVTVGVASCILTGASGVEAQRSSVACTECSIEVTHVVTLRGTAESPQPEPTIMTTVARDARGWYYVAPMADLVSVGVYRPDGALHRAIRVPMQAGASAFVAEVKIRLDTLLAVDQAARVVHAIPLESGQPRRIAIGARAEGILPAQDGGFLAHFHLRTPELVGLPLHALDGIGRRTRSFGDPGLVTSSADPYAVKRNIARGPGGTVFTTWLNRYRIEEWSADGTLRRIIEPSRPWFTPWNSYPPNLRSNPPPPWLDSIRVDVEQGLIWCLIHVPSGRWQSEADIPTSDHAASPTLHERNRVFDTVIEVLDLQTGELIASRRIFSHISGYLNDGSNLYNSRTSDPDGVQHVHVLSLRLVRPRDASAPHAAYRR